MDLLVQYFQTKRIDYDEVIHRRIEIPFSAYISAHKVPSLKTELRSGCVLILESDESSLHHIFAVDAYYGCSTRDSTQLWLKPTRLKLLHMEMVEKSSFGLQKL